jgi:Fe-S-cluster-containing dehydrogenase component
MAINRKFIKVYSEKCTACKTCEIECAIAHSNGGSLEEIIATGEQPEYRIRVVVKKNKNVPVNCRMCVNAACIKACPTKAMRRLSDGAPVLVDDKLCDLCGACIEACPFDSLWLSKDEKSIIKCDLCIRRQAKKLEPACVASCPTNALELHTVEKKQTVK